MTAMAKDKDEEENDDEKEDNNNGAPVNPYNRPEINELENNK